MLIHWKPDLRWPFMSLQDAKLIGEFFAGQGHQISYLIAKDFYKDAKALLGEDVQINRLPQNEEADLEKTQSLRRSGHHHVLINNDLGKDRSFLFQLQKGFRFSILFTDKSPGLLYSDLVVNTSMDASQHIYNCPQHTRLLLGPKYALSTASQGFGMPENAGSWLIESTLFKHPEVGTLLKEALTSLAGRIRPFILEKAGAEVVSEEAANGEKQTGQDQEKKENLGLETVVWHPKQHFEWNAYAGVLLEPHYLCEQLAQRGVFFATMPLNEALLNRSYAMDRQGVAPTPGWHQSLDAKKLASFLYHFSAQKELRHKWFLTRKGVFSGSGLQRIASLIPTQSSARLTNYRGDSL